MLLSLVLSRILIRTFGARLAASDAPPPNVLLAVNPVESAVPKNPPVTPLQSADPKTRHLKSFRICTSAKGWGEGGKLLTSRGPFRTLTFRPSRSSIHQEHGMGTMGLALPWEHRIPPVPRDRERRVEPFREPAIPTGIDPAAEAARAEDSELADACQYGDLRAYERLYALQGARMKNLARNLLGNALDAEDAVQDTFLKVQRSISSFRGQSSFVTWTFRILVNTCHDARRRSVRRKEDASQEVSEGFSSPPESRAPGAHPSLRLALESAIATLTQRQRDVFLLYEVEGFRHAEIAGMLGITETVSKNTLFYAKKSLRQLLAPPRGSQLGGAE